MTPPPSSRPLPARPDWDAAGDAPRVPRLRPLLGSRPLDTYRNRPAIVPVRRRPDRTDVAVVNDCPCWGRIASRPELRPFNCEVCNRSHFDERLRAIRSADEAKARRAQQLAKFRARGKGKGAGR